jgi:hypothetical protein
MAAEMKTCPRCAEDVKEAADVCRHCGYVWPDSDTAFELAEEHRQTYYRLFERGLLVLVLVGLIVAAVIAYRSAQHDAKAKADQDVCQKFDGPDC